MSDSVKILEKVSREFSQDTFFVPVIGSEIEFYLLGNIPEDIIKALSLSLCKAKIDINEVKLEKGKGQYEVSINHSSDVLIAAENIIKARDVIASTAKNEP